jgi:hypothetical protein
MYILLLLPIYEYAALSVFKSVAFPVWYHEVIAAFTMYTPLLITVFLYPLSWFELALDRLDAVKKYLLCAVCAAPVATILVGILHLTGGAEFGWETIRYFTLYFAPIIMFYEYRRTTIGDLMFRRHFGLKPYLSIHASAAFNKKASTLTKSETRRITKQIFALVVGQTRPKDAYIEVSSHLVTKGFHRRLKEEFKESNEWTVSDLKSNSMIYSHIQIFLIAISSGKALAYRRSNTLRIVRTPSSLIQQ